MVRARYGFGKPKGWAIGRLERMWMAQGEGGQRLFIIPALQLAFRNATPPCLPLAAVIGIFAHFWTRLGADNPRVAPS
jgi:hypothetical protein